MSVIKEKPLKDYPLSFFIQAGKRGGDKTAQRGKGYYKSIGKLGGQKRWQKKQTQ